MRRSVCASAQAGMCTFCSHAAKSGFIAVRPNLFDQTMFRTLSDLGHPHSDQSFRYSHIHEGLDGGLVFIKKLADYSSH